MHISKLSLVVDVSLQINYRLGFLINSLATKLEGYNRWQMTKNS